MNSVIIFLSALVAGLVWKLGHWNYWLKIIINLGHRLKNWQDKWGQDRTKRYAASLKARYPHRLSWWEKTLAPLIIYNVAGTIANLISIIRLLLAIIIGLLLFIALSAQGWKRTLIIIISLLIFILAGLGDFIDGWAARAFNEISELGKIIDPFADKLLFASVLIPLGYTYLPTALFWLVAGQEIFLLVISGLKLAAKKLPLTMASQANIGGKFKNVFELTGGAFLFLCFFSQSFLPIAISLLSASVPFGLGSIIGYLSSVHTTRKAAESEAA